MAGSLEVSNMWTVTKFISVCGTIDAAGRMALYADGVLKVCAVWTCKGDLDSLFFTTPRGH
jgi:hypothetical protein